MASTTRSPQKARPSVTDDRAFIKSFRKSLALGETPANQKRVTLELLTEGSTAGGGLDTRKYRADVLQDKLERYKTKTKRVSLTRGNLIEFVAQEYGVSMTMLSATDAILFCRGPQLDQSETYNEDKLIHWLQITLPGMRKLEDRIEPQRMPPRSLNTSQDNFSLFKLSGVGKVDKRRAYRTAGGYSYD